uniref:Uncharacterized protein n=1 Tax=Oryza glaberrima TaxID=4538 RepID=I1PCE4_ORYGL
ALQRRSILRRLSWPRHRRASPHVLHCLSLSLSFLPVPLSSSSSSMVRGSVRRQRVGRSKIQSAIGSGEGRRSARRCRLEVGCWRRPQRGGVGRWAQEANASSLREDGVGTEFSKARSRSGGA